MIKFDTACFKPHKYHVLILGNKSLKNWVWWEHDLRDLLITEILIFYLRFALEWVDRCHKSRLFNHALNGLQRKLILVDGVEVIHLDFIVCFDYREILVNVPGCILRKLMEFLQTLVMHHGDQHLIATLEYGIFRIGLKRSERRLGLNSCYFLNLNLITRKCDD